MLMKQRIYLDAEKKKAVPAGNPRASFLLCAIGQTIPDVIAEQYGLVDGKIKDPPEKVVPPKAETKKEDPPENKSVKNAENKGREK